jgi:hypothetical protein
VYNSNENTDCLVTYSQQFTQLHLKDETRPCLDTDPTSSFILFVGGGDGMLTMIGTKEQRGEIELIWLSDTRTPKVNDYEVHQKKIHAVSVHPINPNTIATG